MLLLTKIVGKRNWTFLVEHFFTWKLEFVSTILSMTVVLLVTTLNLYLFFDHIVGIYFLESTADSSAHSRSMLLFYTFWKHQKTRVFLMFPGGIERDQWGVWCLQNIDMKSIALLVQSFNLFTTLVPHYIETSQLIYRANQLTRFSMMGNIGR